MPRFGFVGDEENLEQKMIATPEREEPPAKHVTAESCTKHDVKAKIAPPEDGVEAETWRRDLVEKEAAREVDVDLTVRAPVVGSKENQYLLDEVATNWKTGKGSHQTEHCTSAIRISLLEGMKPVTIANYVVQHGVAVGEQHAERKRVQDCVSYINRKLGLNINRALKKSGEGARNAAAVSDHGNTLQNAIEAGMASLSISSKAKEDKVSTHTLFNKVENEHHWMFMWRDARIELKKLREELESETDEKVKKELMMDIEGLKKKKDEWAALLGMKV